jgi:hypothetical protein
MILFNMSFILRVALAQTPDRKIIAGIWKK